MSERNEKEYAGYVNIECKACKDYTQHGVDSKVVVCLECGLRSARPIFPYTLGIQKAQFAGRPFQAVLHEGIADSCVGCAHEYDIVNCDCEYGTKKAWIENTKED